MIIAGGRYLLAGTDADRLVWRDRWLRRTRTIVVGNSGDEVGEGSNGFFRVVSHPAAGSVTVSVRHVSRPAEVKAVGEFNEQWTFAGDMQAWVNVAEYVFVERDGRNHLLRIADGAVPDAMGEFQPVHVVEPIPGSRLVMVAGSGFITAWDPVARQAGAHLRLVNGTDSPVMHFRKGDEELWINDGDNLLRFETRTWEPVDAAGTSNELPISTWRFSDDDELCVVLRSGSSEVLILDASTMLVGAVARFPEEPVDAIASGGTKITAVSASGHVMAARSTPAS